MSPWIKESRKEYICFRCREPILAGTPYFSGNASHMKHREKNYYRYHPECKSISGRKEMRITDTFQSFILTLSKGPTLLDGFDICATDIGTCYKRARLLGYDVRRTRFSMGRATHAIYYLASDSKKALDYITKHANKSGNINQELRNPIFGILGKDAKKEVEKMARNTEEKDVESIVDIDEFREAVRNKTVAVAAFIEAFHICLESGELEKFTIDSKEFYELFRKAGFNDDQTIRILSHSFTRMMSEGG